MARRAKAPAAKTPARRPKTTAKVKPSKTKPSVQKLEVNQQSQLPQMPSVKMQKKYVLGVLVIIILGVLLYYFRGLLVAAVVNGQPIPRWQVINEAEKQSGKQALDTLVRNALIEQEAQKQHVSVSDKEVDDQIKLLSSNFAKQGETLDQALAANNMTRGDLREVVKLDKLVQKIVGKNIVVTDREVDLYISANKDSLPQNQSDAQLRSTVKAQLLQQKMQTKAQTWIATLEKNAHVTYFVQY